MSKRADAEALESFHFLTKALDVKPGRLGAGPWVMLVSAVGDGWVEVRQGGDEPRILGLFYSYSPLIED